MVAQKMPSWAKTPALKFRDPFASSIKQIQAN